MIGRFVSQIQLLLNAVGNYIFSIWISIRSLAHNLQAATAVTDSTTSTILTYNTETITNGLNCQLANANQSQAARNSDAVSASRTAGESVNSKEDHEAGYIDWDHMIKQVDEDMSLEEEEARFKRRMFRCFKALGEESELDRKQGQMAIEEEFKADAKAWDEEAMVWDEEVERGFAKGLKKK